MNMKWILVPLLALLLSFIPAQAFAEDGQDDDVLIRVGADIYIAEGERVGTVVVIDGSAVIEGQVAESVFIIHGNATVAGEIGGDLTVISGDIDLQRSAQVQNVTSIRGDIIRAQGATITGELHERDGFGDIRAAVAVFSILLWLGLTVALVAAGLIFAAIGGRQLREAAQRMTADAVNTILGVVFVAVALPTIAFVAIVTLIGVPFGVGLLIFLMPTLWFLGYIVAGARLGSALVGFGHEQPTSHPYAATVLGIVLLQLLVLIPVLGMLVAMVAGLWGAGALTFSAYRAAGGRGFEASGTAAASTTTQAAG
jgi:hypothetical protein